MKLDSGKILFLEILRFALWGKGTFQPGTDVSLADWREALKMAQDHAVIGIVADVIVNRTEGGCPLPLREGLEAGFLATKVQARNRLINHVLDKTVSNFKAEGIPSTLLKGQGIGSLYPDPTLRQGGDIDIYVNEDYFTKAASILNAEHNSEEKVKKALKHIGYEVDEIEIELHRYSDYLSFRPLKNRYFQRLSKVGLNDTGMSFTVGGSSVQIPTPYYNSIFMLQHMWNHMITGGVGFRQVCDWALLLHFHGKDIDPEKLAVDLKSCGLLNAWKFMSKIAVDYLGLPAENCPLLSSDPNVAATSERLLEIIFEDGNFGKKNKVKNDEGRPENYIGSKIHSLKNNFRRLKKTVKYAEPSDRLAYYLEYLRSTTERL